MRPQLSPLFLVKARGKDMALGLSSGLSNICTPRIKQTCLPITDQLDNVSPFHDGACTCRVYHRGADQYVRGLPSDSLLLRKGRKEGAELCMPYSFLRILNRVIYSTHDCERRV